MGARKSEKDFVFLYRGSAREIPWNEMLRAIRAHAGRDATLALTMTCEVANKDKPTHRSDLPPAPADEPVLPAVAEKNESEQRTTIYDVAREAKVSHTTVSRVANDRLCVSPALRARVEEVMARLNYKPSDAARAMVRTRDEKRQNPKDGIAVSVNGSVPPDIWGDENPEAATLLATDHHQKAT